MLDSTHYFAELDESALGEVDQLDSSAPPSSLWREAWRKLRRRPLFLVSVGLIVIILAVALFPSLFGAGDVRDCSLTNATGRPTAGHPMGFDKQGCDIYTMVIRGARPSILVGTLTMLVVLVLGGAAGTLAGWHGRWVDAVLSRLADIFFAIPLVLAAIVFLNSRRDRTGVLAVVLVMAAFGWPQMARIARSAVLAVKNRDFITASRALGVNRRTILVRHVLPNAAGPMIVTATVSMGTYVVAEATLSFLGLGLPIGFHSWGLQIADAKNLIRTDPHILLFPAAALAITVLAFIMLGDAVRDALDPKARR